MTADVNCRRNGYESNLQWTHRHLSQSCHCPCAYRGNGESYADQKDLTASVGSWVCFKRGKFIPRIYFSPKDEASLDGRKRKKAGPSTMRPPQGLFNYEEVIKIYGRKSVSKCSQVYTFQGDLHKNGFVEKDFKLSTLILENANPTLNEIAQFSRNEDGETDNHVDLSIIAEASRKAAVLVLQPGDHVEVFEGEQSGVHGVVDSINQDVVTITAIGVDIDGQKVDVPARSVRKKFKAGDHVKVMTGQNADEAGLVVNVADNIVTFLSDMSMNEVSPFCLRYSSTDIHYFTFRSPFFQKIVVKLPK